MSKFIIYGLVDPRTNLVRYVGRSSSGIRRPRSYVTASQRSKKSHRNDWVGSLLAAGLMYEIAVLETCAAETELNDCEQWWIAYGRSCGWHLANHTDGGDGMSGFKHDEDTKQRLSEKLKARRLSPEHKAKIGAAHKGRTYSEETLAKMSASGKVKVFTSEHRANASKAMTGRVFSDEHKAKIGAANTGKKMRPESIAKMRATKLGVKPSEETRAKMRAAHLGRRQSPESVAKMIATRKARRLHAKIWYEKT
jgi:hypothetical protein